MTFWLKECVLAYRIYSINNEKKHKPYLPEIIAVVSHYYKLKKKKKKKENMMKKKEPNQREKKRGNTIPKNKKI